MTTNNLIIPHLFQTGVGPNMKTLHIRQVGDKHLHGGDNNLSLCRSVNIARNYFGAISFNNPAVCKKCLKIVRDTLPKGTEIFPSYIGVNSIED